MYERRVRNLAAALPAGVCLPGTTANLPAWKASAPAPVVQASYQISGLDDLALLDKSKTEAQRNQESRDESTDGFALLSDLALPQVVETSSPPLVDPGPSQQLSTQVCIWVNIMFVC